MSKYIDAEWLKEHTEFISYTGMWHETETGEFVSRETMEEAPNIDIVRCGECKWFDSKGHCMRLTAEYGTYEDVRTDDFCSYGERKESE